MRDHNGRVYNLKNISPERRLELTPFPCGWCLPCRINKARTWQHRIILESKSHLQNSFVTLTYSDEQIPFNDNGDLVLFKPDLQNYMKRLRKIKQNERIRYFAVGEYGTKSNRPHYHLCLFGLGADSGDHIADAWTLKKEPIGFVHVGNITPESARYIAGYTIKKLTRKNDERLNGKPPEFMISSKKDGGIGHDEVIRIAKELKKNPYISTDNIINSFQIGGKTFPLGGYLTKKLFDELGWDNKIKEKNLIDYQNKLFTQNEAYGGEYYHNIVKNSEQYRLNLESKNKIYKKDKKL